METETTDNSRQLEPTNCKFGTNQSVTTDDMSDATQLETTDNMSDTTEPGTTDGMSHTTHLETIDKTTQSETTTESKSDPDVCQDDAKPDVKVTESSTAAIIDSETTNSEEADVNIGFETSKNEPHLNEDSGKTQTRSPDTEEMLNTESKCNQPKRTSKLVSMETEPEHEE